MHGGDIYSQKIKYDFSVNINPLGLPRSVKKIWRNSLKVCEHYPDMECSKLKKLLSSKISVSADQIIFGNGASELISEVIKMISPKTALLSAPFFTGYKKALACCKTKVVLSEISDLENENCFTVTQKKINSLIQKIEDEKPELLILCNPNNPDGNLIEKKYLIEIAEICRQKNIFVLLDESFIELTGKEDSCSMKNEIQKFSNLFIVRAFTKTYAVPGLRLGYGLCADGKILSAVKERLPEWNVSSLAQEIGLACLKEKNYLKIALDKIEKERKFISCELKKIGIRVYDSNANFILIFLDCDLKEELLRKEILIRDCSDYDGLEKGFFRVAIKCHRENKILVREIGKILEKVHGKN